MNAASSSMSSNTSGSSGRIHTPLQHLKILRFRNGGVCKKVIAFHMGRQCTKAGFDRTLQKTPVFVRAEL